MAYVRIPFHEVTSSSVISVNVQFAEETLVGRIIWPTHEQLGKPSSNKSKMGLNITQMLPSIQIRLLIPLTCHLWVGSDTCRTLAIPNSATTVFQTHSDFKHRSTRAPAASRGALRGRNPFPRVVTPHQVRPPWTALAFHTPAAKQPLTH